MLDIHLRQEMTKNGEQLVIHLSYEMGREGYVGCKLNSLARDCSLILAASLFVVSVTCGMIY